MNFDKLTIAIHPRRDWEAVDLGILMARRWWWMMTKTWCLITLPVLLLVVVLPPDWIALVPFLLWWLKPLFERPLLLILSRAVFGENPTLRQVLAACPRLFLQQTMAGLTWRRLSPHRSMDLPVVQLEGLKGEVRRSRLDVLHREGHAPAKWLTLIGVHLESFVMLALLATLLGFIPTQMQLNFFDTAFWFESRLGLAVQTMTYYFSIAVVAPFYVACGFSLYLNRRIKLEGWDLEIGFKRILSKRGLLAPVAAVLMCAAALCLPLAPAQVQAQPADAERVSTERELIHEQMQKILAGDDFHNRRLQKSLQFKPLAELEDEPESTTMPEWLAAIGKAIGAVILVIASIAELLLWACVIGAAVYFAIHYRTWLAKWRHRSNPRAKRPHAQPQTLFGLDVRAQSLPRDVGAAAEQLWQQQDYRAALALLYRASLSKLLACGLPLRDSSTEGECLALALSPRHHAKLTAPNRNYFEQLTNLWQALAYGHQLPRDETALSLCRQWNSHWAEADHAE